MNYIDAGFPDSSPAEALVCVRGSSHIPLHLTAKARSGMQLMLVTHTHTHKPLYVMKWEHALP